MTVLVPATLDDACAALAARPGATVLAGGTDLMVGINAARARPTDVVAVGRLPELRAWASAALVVDGEAVRLALGSVGPGPIRCVQAEAYAASGGRDPAVFGSLAAEAARPIDDHRSSAAYRRRAVEVIARRAFERAVVR